MVSDVLYLISAVVVRLLFRQRWVVVVASMAGAALAGVMMWKVGLEEDVPPVMLAVSSGMTLMLVVVVALLVHSAKAWCMRRWAKVA